MSDETQVIDETPAPPETPPAVTPEPDHNDAAERIATLEAELAEARAAIDESMLDKAALEAIAEAEAEVEDAAEEMEAAKKTAAARKKDWEASVQRLQRVIRDRKAGSLPLFEKPAPAAAAPTAEPAPSASAIGEDDAWKGVLVTTLLQPDGKTLPQGILDALAEKDLLTVGDLANWSEPRPKGKGQRLIDIPGIGPGKAQQIEDALAEFWTRRALDARKALDAEIAEGVKEAEAAKAESRGPCPAPPELTEANAWRVHPIAEMDLEVGLVEILRKGGLHTAGDLAFAVFTEWVDTIPGVDLDEFEDISAALDAFRAGLPDVQAFDFSEFEASNVPTPADAQPVKRKKTKKAAPTS